MRNILIGADLTVKSENAFLRAIQLARLTRARLHVLHVDRRFVVPGDESQAASRQSEVRGRVDNFVHAHAKLAEIDYEVHLETRGRVYEVIDQYAQSTRADLVIVGRSKRDNSLPSSVLLTTGQVVAISDCPVLVVTQPVSGNYKHILLEADLFSSSGRAIAIVCDFGPNIELTMLQSSNGESAPGGFFQRLQAKSRKRKHRKLVARTVGMLQQRGLGDDRLSFEAVERDPVDTLLLALGETKFDVVAFSNVRRKLRAPEMRDSIVSLVPAATCDILFDPT